MSKILVLKSSIMGPASQTNSLIDAFLSERRQKALHDEIIEHDLTTLELPVLDSELFDALRNGQNLSSRARQVVTLSDQLIAELKKSEILVIGAPMYNLNVPTQLKNWFDLVARAGVTFKYTETYPQGLVEGVKAVVISSRGGIHVDQATDAVTPYLRSVLSLLGINDVEFV
jgi:FMN-dependent NADH-azoreductase